MLISFSRCAETLRSLFENAAKPDLLRVSIVDQISLRDGEKTCVESYCNLVGQSCRVSQVIWKQIDALDAKVQVILHTLKRSGLTFSILGPDVRAL